MNFINEIAISSDSQQLEMAKELQRQLELDHFSASLLPEYAMEEDDEREDIIDDRYNLLRNVGAGTLIVITSPIEQVNIEDSLPYPLMADIEAAAELRQEGLYQRIHTSHPLEYYGESAAVLQKLDVKPIKGNKYARILTDKENQ